MKEEIHISHFCIIRNSKVMVDKHILYSEKEAPVPDFLKNTYKHFKLDYPKFYKMDYLCKLGFLAAELLINKRDLGMEFGKDRTGIILANAASSLDTDRNYQLSIDNRNNYFPSPSVFVYTLPNIVMGEICIRHKLFGENTFFVQEKFDTGFMHHYIIQLFENEIVTCCITGWVEMEGDHHDAVLYLVEKTVSDNGGIAIFDAENMKKYYCLKF